MNPLQALITKLCPNGVEFKSLGEVCEIVKGQQLNKEKLLSHGKFPVMNGGISPSGFWNENNCEANRITISQGGASAGYVNFITIPFWAGAHCYVVENEVAEVCYKFLYFFLKNQQDFLMTSQYGAGIPALAKQKLTSLPIPIPPLEIQNRIVEILDTFTELERELERELNARKKQYEFYRNALLSFESLQTMTNQLTGGGAKVKMCSLGEVCEILNNLRIPISKDQRMSGKYPYYGANGIQDYVNSYLFDGTYLLMGEDGSVINQDKSPVLNWAKGKFWVNNHAHILGEKTEIAKLRFLFFYLQTCDVSPIVRGTPPKINQENLKKIKIPIPPIEVQNKVVEILDRFDAMVSSITEGLPAEIQARRKQYEYYRDRLLSFEAKC